MFVLQLLRRVKLPVEVDCRRVDVVKALGAKVDELGIVDRAVGRSDILYNDRRTGVSLVVDVGQVKMCVERRALGGEGQPMAVG